MLFSKEKTNPPPSTFEKKSCILRFRMLSSYMLGFYIFELLHTSILDYCILEF